MIDMTIQSTWSSVGNHMDILENEEANKHYRYKSVEKLLENTSDLLDMILHHEKHQVPRLEILEKYYLNKNVGIKRRPKRGNPIKSDVRMSHAYAQYITDFNVGYRMGIPVNVDYDDDEINEDLKTFQHENDMDAFNTVIDRTRSKFGRAYELQYRNTDGMDMVKEASVYNTFMVYDKTIEKNQLFGVYYVEDDGEYTIEIHTADEVIYFNEVDEADDELVVGNQEYHNRGEVDITEYMNNLDRLSDFEMIINQIDGIDFSQSDLANHMNDLNEGKTIIKTTNAALMDADEDDVIQANRDSDVLLFDVGIDGSGNPGSVDVSYLERTYDVEGSESYKKRLESNIHKLSYVPNFDDEFFANNSSGVATQFKLYLSNHKTRVSQHLFEKGLRKRYRMWAHFKEEQEELSGYNPRSLTIKMHLNIPVSFKDEIQAHVNAGGKLSQETLLAQLSIVDDVDTEKKRIASEQAAIPTKPEPNSSASAVSESPTH